jgi:hypothetical protein
LPFGQLGIGICSISGRSDQVILCSWRWRIEKEKKEKEREAEAEAAAAMKD